MRTYHQLMPVNSSDGNVNIRRADYGDTFSANASTFVLSLINLNEYGWVIPISNELLKFAINFALINFELPIYCNSFGTSFGTLNFAHFYVRINTLWVCEKSLDPLLIYLHNFLRNATFSAIVPLFTLPATSAHIPNVRRNATQNQIMCACLLILFFRHRIRWILGDINQRRRHFDFHLNLYATSAESKVSRKQRFENIEDLHSFSIAI